MQEGLAYEAGITTGTLSQLERGISNPSWGTLKAIAGALGVSMVELAKLTAKFEQQPSSWTPGRLDPGTRRIQSRYEIAAWRIPG